jgi:serine/threonine protein kinase
MLQKADVWSMGVILYTMLFGGFPWTPGDKDCVQNIVAGRVSAGRGSEASSTHRLPCPFTACLNCASKVGILAMCPACPQYFIPPGVAVSASGLHMLSRLLCADPEQRWSTAQIQEHPWCGMPAWSQPWFCSSMALYATGGVASLRCWRCCFIQL